MGSDSTQFADVARAAEDLSNREAGWVTRRDGATHLGEAALQAIEVLMEHAGDKDVDVQTEVGRTLEKVRARLGMAEQPPSGAAPAEAARAHSLEDLVHYCEKAGQRTVRKHEDGFIVSVKLRSDRHQDVHVTSVEPKDGVRLIRVFTQCGEAQENEYAAALRVNMKLAQSALALKEIQGTEMFVLVNTFIASEVTPREMKAAVKEIAQYGDWVERKLSGGDAF